MELIDSECDSKETQVVNILQEEANELAKWYERNKPEHRVGIAIQREIRRLRKLSEWMETK